MLHRRLPRNAKPQIDAADAKPKPEKKPAARAAPATIRVLPRELRVGDRLVDETGEWEIIGRPYTTAGGKNARVRVHRVGAPVTTISRTHYGLFGSGILSRSMRRNFSGITAVSPRSGSTSSHGANSCRSIAVQRCRGLPESVHEEGETGGGW